MVDLPENTTNMEQGGEGLTDDRRKRNKIALRVLEELKKHKAEGFEPTADIDIVWVLSAPGTVKEISTDGAYAGASSDLTNVNHGIELVRQITAKRMGKDQSEVTKEDIGEFGPILFYNGEDSETEGTRYAQNRDFEELVATPDFPVPASKVVIDHIDRANSIAQIEGIAKYLKDHNLSGKIATVSIGAHSARMGRYFEKYKGLFPDNIELLNAAATQTHNPIETTGREIDKIYEYGAKGDLAEDSYFKHGE